MSYAASLFLALLGLTASAHAEEDHPAAVEEATEPSEAPFKIHVVPAILVGLAFRLDFEETPHKYEPFLVAGGGVFVHITRRVAFVPTLTASVAPTGTWGFGANLEWEFEVVRDHLTIDLIPTVYQETNHNTSHTDVVAAAGLGLSVELPREVAISLGMQLGVDVYTGEMAGYPFIDLSIPFPRKSGSH